MTGDQGAGAPPIGNAAERLQELAARLGEVLGEPLAREPRQLSSGASRETFAFASAGRGELIAQLERRRGGLGERPPAQSALLAAAGEAGVPVARLVAHGRDDPVLGSGWLIVEALEGTTDPAQILAGDGVPEAAKLIDSIAAALAAVHRMPAEERLAGPVEDPLALLRDAYERLGEPHPTFELAFRVLAGGAPPARRSFVHGDFRIGNLMVGREGVTGVLDWELAHLGDPVEDLGWLCVPAWRFARPDRPAAGLGTREQLLSAYERYAGVEVDRDAQRWWELAGTLRWGVICVMQASRHLSGATRSIELAVIGRRACEVEWDLLVALAERSGVAPPPPDALEATAPPQSSVHDRPTALELIEAARGSLGDEVLPLLEGRAAFELRVTLRALGMVGRELRHADAHAALRRQALSRMGVADEAELAAAIRSGALEARKAELHAALRSLVRAKLEAAHPSYLERSDNAPAKEAP